MNKDLENVIKEVGDEIWAHTYCCEIDSLIHHSQDKVDSLVKYRDYTIAQIIELTRIERLFDLKLISLQDKKTLLKEYKEYRELCSRIFSFELTQFKEKISKDEKSYLRKLDEKLYLRKEELKTKLFLFGILGDFNFEEAIINEVDKKLKQKVK